MRLMHEHLPFEVRRHRHHDGGEHIDAGHLALRAETHRQLVPLLAEVIRPRRHTLEAPRLAGREVLYPNGGVSPVANLLQPQSLPAVGVVALRYGLTVQLRVHLLRLDVAVAVGTGEENVRPVAEHGGHVPVPLVSQQNLSRVAILSHG